MLFITHDEFWRKFCTEAGRPEWLADERFATMAARTRHRDVVLDAIAALMATDTAARWVGRLAPLGIVVSCVETLEHALASELAAARRMVVELPCEGARLRAVGAAVKFDGQVPAFGEPPLLGQHTAELLGGAR
jgi:crotonobetainyl-CoA:carnitine CoA-transferase CaiB-like acyl-CoA transferase